MCELSQEEGELAVRIARESIEKMLEVETSGIETDNLPPIFSRNRGVFVTLEKSNSLRGCIGHPYPDSRLINALEDSSRSAAFRDPRFEPLKKQELKEVTVEVTVLTPPQPIEGKAVERSKHVLIGKDGLIVKKGRASGLLLPQVAVDHNFSAEEFLDQTCLKAGLMPDAWLEDMTQVLMFQGQIFSEKEPGGKIIGTCFD